MRNSLYNINIDFEKSNESYVFDKNTNRSYLDFMCMFSSMPLGYSHPVFDENFVREISKVAHIRMTGCEYTCDEREEFEKEFEDFAGVGIYKHFHYACTGALAVEHAIKAAFSYKRITDPEIVSHTTSFHGITSYGNILTGRTDIVGPRLDGFPGNIWPKFNTIEDLEKILESNKRIAGIIIEPIQSTNGDIHFDVEYFRSLKMLSEKFDVPLIFDEIQTGFCSTGKKWYFQHVGIVPDIVVFGKKSQVCGVMATDKMGELFKTPSKICITWDGDLVDMVRSKYIMKAIKENSLDKNSEKMGNLLLNGLKSIGLDSRGKGLLVAFDLSSREKRDLFYKRLKDAGMICNPTGERSIRLRPNLAVSEKEICEALRLIKLTLEPNS